MMEKGSFHTSAPVQPHIKKADEAVRKVALPNQLPPGIDFSEIPVGHLKSATLESLINQNEDLMARLSVSLRRTNEFEDRVASLESENTNLRVRFEALREQYMVKSEKDRIATSRTVQLHEESVGYKRKLEKLEKIYSELFVQAQAFQGRVIKLERNQARLRKAGKSLQKNAKAAPQLRQELDHSALVQQQSTQSYEVKLADVRSQIEGMRGKLLERDGLYSEKVTLENELIRERRQNESKASERQEVIDRLSSETTSLRVQLKDALVGFESAKQEAASLSVELPSLRFERQSMVEQVESLQALWDHKQREFEVVEEKNRALQKLNQSVSTNLNQQRKEIHALNQELEKERFQAQEKIKNLLSEIQMLRATKDSIAEA